MIRVRLSCDRCDFAAWIGPAEGGWDAWCEACQEPARLAASAGGLPSAACAQCCVPLTVAEPRFEELWGELQNLVAVIEAMLGDHARLTPLVPDRPRTLSEAPDTAGWNHASAILHEEVAARGFPSAERLAAARASAGPPSSFWSDLTVGRLLFALVAERAAEQPAETHAMRLRQAEAEVEFQTFTDQAMLILGYGRLGLNQEVERIALPLALETAAALRGQPFLHGPSGRDVSRTLETTLRQLAGQRAAEALGEARALLARPDLMRYRIPCARCGRGTIGVERLAEPDGAAPARAPETMETPWRDPRS